MKTIGHHTCKKSGSKSHIIRNAPFLSKYSPNSGKIPFLGAGYYFWDNNLDMAEQWGRLNYQNKYCVVEGELTLNKPTFLDLVGNRGDIIYFRELIHQFSNNGYPKSNWTLGKFIEFLKNLERNYTKYKGIFPYNVIRAVDNSNKHKLQQHSFIFVKKKGAYTFLDPRIIICFTDQGNVNLHNQQIKVW